MDNVIKAYFYSGNIARTNTVFQYNRGMILKFMDVDLPATYRVDFANSLTGQSKTCVGTADGVIVPLEMMAKGCTVYAWAVIANEDSTVTEYQAMIPISPRAEPTDEAPNPEQQQVIDQLIAAMNQAMEQTGADVESADAAAATAAASAQAAAASEAAASASEQAAAASETAAAGSASSASDDAATAASAASTATQQAGIASSGAETATQKAADAAASEQAAASSETAAAGSASSASADAATAASAASTATQQAGIATSGAETATQKAADAAASAQDAASSETAAAGSAAAAATSETNAGAAATAAQTAKAAAEAAAQSVSESAAQIETNKEDIADLKSAITQLQDVKNVTPLLSEAGYFYNSDYLQYWQNGAWGVLYFACEPNTEYTISKTSGDYFVCAYITDEPAINTAVYGYTNYGDATTAKFTTGNDAKYVLIQVTNNSNNLPTILAATSVSYVTGAKDNIARDTLESLEGLPEDVEEINDILEEITEEYTDVTTTDIYPDLTWTSGYMNTAGGATDDPSSSLRYSSKFAVSEGDVIAFQNSNFQLRFVTAYNGNTAVSASGASEVYTYTVPANITNLIITIYKSTLSNGINKTHTQQKLRVTGVAPIITPMGYMMKKGAMSNEDELKLPYHNVKIDNIYIFTANITSFSSIKFQKEASLVVDGTNITITNDNSPQPSPIPHGLTIENNITVMIQNNTSSYTSLIRISSSGFEFEYTTPVRFLMDQNAAKIISVGSTLTDCIFSWVSKNINAPIWMFGDSYFSWYPERWTYYLARDGYTKSVMLNGFAGQASLTAYDALDNLLKVTTPKIVVWCLGMNDGDTSNAVNASWKTVYDKLILLQVKYGFELVLYTVPTTPTINNNYKNAIIRASDYRYIDADKAVRIDNDGHWIGYNTDHPALDVDDVHPTAYGAKILYYAILTALPEIMCDR